MKINLLKMFFNTLIEIFCTLWIEMLSLSFSDSCDISKMEKLDTLSAKADLTYFIALALQKELSWNALAIVFEGFKFTNEQYKYVLKFLLKELEQLQEQLESKDNQVSEAEYSNEIYDNPLSEVEADVKLDESDQSIQDLYEHDTEDFQNEAMPIAFEIKQKKIIDNEHYRFDGDDIAEIIPENDGTQTKKSISDKQRFEIADETTNEVSQPLINKKKYQCNICKRYINTNQNLKAHKMIHRGEKPFKCKSCPKTFTQSQNLRTHERIHSGEKPFKCKSCFKSFTQKVNLVAHERCHTGEKLFKCNVCSKTFRDSRHLKRHERIMHCGEKPFQCKSCTQAFSARQNLVFHERIHSGERPFHCVHCNRSYRSKYSLATHEKYHSGQKPFQCQMCSKRFTLRGDLKKHEKRHAK